MRIKKKKIYVFLIVFVVICIISGYFFWSSAQSKDLLADSVYEQLDLRTGEGIENQAKEETGIVLNDSNFINDFQMDYEKKVQIEVTKYNEEQANLSITVPDMYSILKHSEDEQKILQIINSENCPLITNKIKINYEKKNGKYQVKENEELIYAIFGGMDKYFEEKGL